MSITNAFIQNLKSQIVESKIINEDQTTTIKMKLPYSLEDLDAYIPFIIYITKINDTTVKIYDNAELIHQIQDAELLSNPTNLTEMEDRYMDITPFKFDEIKQELYMNVKNDPIIIAQYIQTFIQQLQSSWTCLHMEQ